jgi:hypothetical protein
MARGPELKVKFQMLARFNRLAEMARVDPRIKSGAGHDGFVFVIRPSFLKPSGLLGRIVYFPAHATISRSHAEGA